MIHPPAWRAAGTTNNNTMTEVRRALRKVDMEWISMTSKKDCGKVFVGKSTPFDVYVARKSNTPNSETEIEGVDGKPFYFCVKEAAFVPNFQCDDLERILAKEGEERVNVVRSASVYETRRPWMSDENIGDFKHPCVRSISANEKLQDKNGGEPTLWYSSEIRMDASGNPVHFGIPKVIFGISHESGIPHVDRDGKYGLMEFAASIVDDPLNLDLIAKAMDGSRFRKVMDAARFNTEDWNRHVIPLFRKDFWKEFVDGDGNLIDENGNRIDRNGNQINEDGNVVLEDQTDADVSSRDR